MADYVPAGSTVWTGTGNGGRADFRFEVTKSYTPSSSGGTTSLSIRLQARFMGNSTYLFSNGYNLESGSVSIAGSTTTFNNDYYVKPTAIGEDKWFYVLKKSDSSIKTWTVSISHSASGAASVTLSMTNINLYQYSGGNYNIRLGGTYSSTIDLSQTVTYTLTINAGTGSTITVKRNNVTLSNGASITYGDSLTVTFAPNSGYTLDTTSIKNNGVTATSPVTVAGNVVVAATATVTPATYTLTIDKDAYSTITVKKGSTTLSDGDTITAGDTLTITFGTTAGYTLTLHTVNGSDFASGGNHTVSGDVAVKARSTANATDGGAWIYVNNAQTEYQAYIYTSGGWGKYAPYIYTSNGWVKY